MYTIRVFCITCNFYITYIHFRQVHGLYVYTVITVCVIVKENSSDIIEVQNILALKLRCDLMMAWTVGRNM
jgi:hypothetical protein